MKLICHVDMDAFFVSVEELFDPSLKGKPVVVGGKADQRGVVAAASYAARKYGVHSAMPLRTAARLCPQALFVEGHPTRYREYSRKVYEVLQKFSPAVEMASIDEAYVDLTGTGRLFGPPLKAAHLLHEEIRTITQLRCSIGLAGSRLVAKVCSDLAKPNGIFHVIPGEEARVLAPLEIRKIPGIGAKTEASLHNLGILRVGDLAKLDDHLLAQHFGRWGLALAGKARGVDAGGWFSADFGDDEAAKSISHEHTFGADTAKQEQIETALFKLSEMVAKRLREHGQYGRTIQLKLRTHDFLTITRARTLDHATQLDGEIASAVVHLFRQAWDGSTPVRLIGVYAGSLETAEGQLNLLEEPQVAKARDALRSVDYIRAKYGDSSISLAKTLHAGIRERVHENPFDLPGQAASDKKNDDGK